MSTGALLVAGIDIGSSAIKIAVMKDTAVAGTTRMLAGVNERTRRRDSRDVATALFATCLREAKVEADELAYIATTGDGEELPFRTGHFYGMTTHAKGALYLDPRARAALDIGALHTRAILFDDRAKVLGYRMTSQCASGSGQFLENICRYLGTTLEEIGPLSLTGEAPESCSSICAVLAETDVINMVSRGIATSNIIRGIHDSMAGRYAKLLLSAKAKGIALVTGGLAADVGLVAALTRAVDAQGAGLALTTHPDSALAGAIGAAMWGAFRVRKLERERAARPAPNHAGEAFAP